MSTSFGLGPEPRRSRIRRLGTVGRVKVGGRNRVGALGGYCARRIDADSSDRSPRAAECGAETGVLVPESDSAAPVRGAGNSNGTSAMWIPTWVAAARSI